MLIIDSKDCENIDKALKKYKKKFEKSNARIQKHGRKKKVSLRKKNSHRKKKEKKGQEKKLQQESRTVG